MIEDLEIEDGDDATEEHLSDAVLEIERAIKFVRAFLPDSEGE